MKKVIPLLLIVILIVIGLQHLWPYEAFKFPSATKYKLLKNDKVIGNCLLTYEKKGKLEETSALTLKGFGGLGLTYQEWLFTYILTRDSSVHATFKMKGKKLISEIRLKESLGFDGRSGKVFVCKDVYSPYEFQAELFTQYPVIDLVSSFFVTSQKVASGNHSKPEMFNLLLGKSTRIIEMRYTGIEKIFYQGKEVSTLVLVLINRNNDEEIFRFKIFKDANGCCFPVSAVLTYFTGGSQEIFEMRATEIKNKP